MSYKTEVFIDREKSKQTSSPFAKFMAALCPCLKKKSHKAYKLDTLSQKQDTFIQNESQMFDLTLTKTNSRTQSTKPSICHSIAPCTKYDTDVEDYFSKKITSSQSQIHKYVSVRGYEEDRLILVGNQNKVFFRIHSKLIKMSANSAEKTKSTLDKVSIKTPKFPNAKMEGWWKKRYILFDKFDQGIKFDEESYISTPPESLASYVATRLKFNNIIHAYGGIGAYDIKLANFCQNIVVTDLTQHNKECISHNSTVYMVDNVDISDESFLEMKPEESKTDCVLITPPWGEHYSISEEYDIEKMKIDELFAKALQMTSNVVLILPSNINMEKLAEKLSKGLYTASGKLNQNCFGSCSFEIEKICFMNRIRFIVVYYGPLATKEIKLPEQLDAIYDIIGNSKHKCRRITKYIRQEYGLPFLLKLSLRSAEQHQSTPHTNPTILDRLIQICEKQKIIPDAKLKSFLNKNVELRKVNSKKVNINGEVIDDEQVSEARESQKTQTYTNSFVSSYDVGGVRDHLDGTRRTINIECSGTGSVKLSKLSMKMSVEPEMVKTKIR